MAILNKSKFYNSDVQVRVMKKYYPQFRAIKRHHNDIEFIGDLRVKSTFPIYTISVRYLGNRSPVVKIINPVLVEDTLHYYKAAKCLCLYHPRDFKWHKERLIAREIMQWTAAWIYFYQVWLEKGKWFGPEAKH